MDRTYSTLTSLFRIDTLWNALKGIAISSPFVQVFPEAATPLMIAGTVAGALRPVFQAAFKTGPSLEMLPERLQPYAYLYKAHENFGG
jgi:hypothetical protein